MTPTEETYERLMANTVSRSIRLACFAAELDEIACEQERAFVKSNPTDHDLLVIASQCRQAAHEMRRIATRLE